MPSTVTSTAPAYLDALFTALALRAGLTGIQVQQTYPGDTLRAAAIYAGKITLNNSLPVRAGQRVKRQEDYTCEIIVDVCDGGNDWTKARNTAFGLAGEIDDQVAGNPIELAQPSNASLIIAHCSVNEASPYYDETRRGWAWLLKLEIAVTARLN